MTAKFIEYGSTKHDELEQEFNNGKYTLYDAYVNPSKAKREAYEQCLSDCWKIQIQLFEAVERDVECYHCIRSHNSQIFTFMAKYEVYNDIGSGFILYNIWYPTRQERYIVLVD